jgi:hypothetical protein
VAGMFVVRRLPAMRLASGVVVLVARLGCSIGSDVMDVIHRMLAAS